MDIEAKIREIQQLDGLKLQMGSGKKPLDGFINIDLYEKETPNTLNVPMELTPFASNTIDYIYSSHSLEHLPIRRAKRAFSHWANILKPCGELFLAVPDLETICINFLSANEQQRSDWWVYTLFGYQVDTGIPPSDKSLYHKEDPGQFHQCGFTEASLRLLCQENYLTVEELAKYDGYGTPSLWLQASKNE